MKNAYRSLVAAVSLTLALGAAVAMARDDGAAGAGFGGDFHGIDSFSTADDAAHSFDANHPNAAADARNDEYNNGYGGYGGAYDYSGPAGPPGPAGQPGPAGSSGSPSAGYTSGRGILVSPGAMPSNAVTVSAGGATYRYAAGLFYKPSGNGFVIADPPLGATVSTLPPHYIKLDFGAARPPLYYDGVYGAYYAPASGGSYTVVQPPQGTVVPVIPKDYTKFIKEGVEYDQYNGLVYRQYFSGGNVVYAVT